MARMIHAYIQSPWRTKRQMYVSTLIGMLTIALVAAAYLSVTARAAIVGREILVLQEKIAENRRINEALQTDLAFRLSTSELERRARELGFRPVRADEIQYVLVTGYIQSLPRTALAPSYQPGAGGGNDLPVEYTMSLLDWFGQQMRLSPGASR